MRVDNRPEDGDFLPPRRPPESTFNGLGFEARCGRCSERLTHNWSIFY